MSDDEVVLVSEDHFMSEQEGRVLVAGVPLAVSPKQMVEIGVAGEAYMDACYRVVRNMSKEDAERIRDFRVRDRLSWRAVAAAIEVGFWKPHDNQLAGMAMCRKAAEVLGEDWRNEPWN